MTRRSFEVIRAEWIQPDGTPYASADVDHEVRQDVLDLIAMLDAAQAGHIKVLDPKHGCCAPPKLCEGHAPECRSREHPLGGVKWPCSIIRAIEGN